MGDIDAIGDIVGTGCAVAAPAVAPATMVPTSKSPVNQRFMRYSPSLVVSFRSYPSPRGL